MIMGLRTILLDSVNSCDSVDVNELMKLFQKQNVFQTEDRKEYSNKEEQ
jgi:hypothetical protein